MKVGAFVRAQAPYVVGYCHEHPAELAALQDPVYSKAMFGLTYPFFAPSEALSGSLHERYYATPYDIGGQPYRLTNDWKSGHLPAFVAYLLDRGLIDPERAEMVLADAPAPGAPKATGLPKPYAISDAQNAAVRSVISRLRPDTETYGGWAATLEWFGHACAYCGASRVTFQQDHVVPINQTHLGEHKRGNLVPACADCNQAKGQQGFRAFLRQAQPADAEVRIARLVRFMRSRDYVPLLDDPDVDHAAALAEVQAVRATVKQAADDAVAHLVAMLPS